MSYADSHLDLKRTQQYAKRVARETKKPLSPGFAVEWGKPQTRQVEEVKQEPKFFGLFTTTKTIMREETYTPVTVSIGEHWILHQRNYHVNDSRSEYSEKFCWVLLPSGELKYVWKWDEYLLSARYLKQGGSVELMTVDHILRLDHRPKSREQHRNGVSAWGDREDGPVTRHAKGVGLSLALRALLES